VARVKASIGCTTFSGSLRTLYERYRDKAGQPPLSGRAGEAAGRKCRAPVVGHTFPARAVAREWPKGLGAPYVVCTGGEPLLQLDAALVRALHDEGFEIALETNGTMLPPDGIDWICLGLAKIFIPLQKG